jgi:hypothetical protein
MVGAGILFWARLPDRTVDLLTFSESAFGIGITVIALIFALVTVNQIKEIDRRFAEITKDIEKTANERFGALQSLIFEMVSTEKANFGVQQRQAAELVDRAERANDISQTNFTTAMTDIAEVRKQVAELTADLSRRVGALEAKTK